MPWLRWSWQVEHCRLRVESFDAKAVAKVVVGGDEVGEGIGKTGVPLH